jgi:pilus assembly protein FimV
MPPVSVGPGEYGPTKRNDTLWKVASQVRPDAGVSMEQTMLSLLRANPEAFDGNNINNLKAGYILRVPSREDMLSMSRADARAEASAQYAAWREARGLAQPVPAQAQSVSSQVTESRLELVSPESAEAGAASGKAQDDVQLKQLQSELLMANEALEEQRRQGEEMSGRLSVLEEQILNMQRLIQLKDEELARLQAQTGADSSEQPGAELDSGEALAEVDALADAPVTEATEVAKEDEPLAVDALTAADQLAADAAPAETVTEMDTELVLDETIADTPLADAEMEEGPAEGLIEDTVEEQVVAEEPQVAPAVAEPAVPETAASPGFMDQLLGNPLWLGAGAGVLGLLAFFGLRRKRGVESEFQESILQAAQESSASAPDSELVAAEPVSTQPVTSESSLLSEFAVSDMGAIRNDGEADPLAEADVYLAYGRYQQAEDLIKDALENDAEREDLNLKLLEIYLAGRNKTAFDEHAEGVLARLENSEDPLWEKVSEMGRELSPENPMYKTGAASSLATDADAETDSLSDAVDLGMDSEVVESQAFETTDETVEEIKKSDEGLDFDLDLSFDAEAGAAAEQSETQQETEQSGVETSEPELKVAMDSVEPDAVAEDNALDFDLEGFELDDEAVAEAEMEGDGELADMDEVSTKLDLARAYIDMGDPDGAKNILDEVMDEGNDDQKDEARGIMAQMS